MRQCAGSLPTEERPRRAIWGPTYPGVRITVFPGESTVTQEAEGGCILSQKPSVENYEVWLEWRGHLLDMLDWWEELVAIPHVDDHHRLAQKVQASFQIPQARCKALKVSIDYSSPATLKCIGRKAFLPIPDPSIPCQDYREGQPVRPWHIPRPYSIRSKRPTSQSLMNCAFWQDAFMS